MEKRQNIFLKIGKALFGLLFICFIIACLAGLFKFLYFHETSTAVPEQKAVNRFTKTIDESISAKEHFHMLDEKVYSDVQNAPVCLRCHGNFCHTKSKELRSFYNMHTFYIACETCHVRQKAGESFVFKWFYDTNGAEAEELYGPQGSYGAKIVPVQGGRRLDAFPKEALAQDYLAQEARYSEAEKKKMQEELMAHVSERAVTCSECHQRGGYLDFAALGYDQSRLNRLVQLEIMQLIDEYKEFYLPTMFDPRKAGRAE